MGPMTSDGYRAYSGCLGSLYHFQAHSLCPQVLCPGPASHLHRREAHPGCFDLAYSKAEGKWLFPQFWGAPEQCHEGNVSPGWLHMGFVRLELDQKSLRDQQSYFSTWGLGKSEELYT